MHRLNVNIISKLLCFDSAMFFVVLEGFFCYLWGQGFEWVWQILFATEATF